MVQSEWDDARSTILRLLRQTGAVAPEWLHIDRVWQEPNSLREFAAALAVCFQEIDSKHPFSKIVLVDSLGLMVGATPIGGMLSATLNKPLVVWKETSSLLSIKPLVSGTEVTEPVDVAVLYCVTRYGSTAAEVIESLADKGYRSTVLVTVMDLGKGAGDLIQKTARRRSTSTVFCPILTAQEVQSGNPDIPKEMPT